MTKLIALDLDGTLLTSQQTISPRTSDCLFRATQAGHLVTLATGRPLSSTLGYARQLEIKYPFLVLNGAWITDVQGRTISDRPIDPDTAMEFLLYCTDNDITCTLVAKDQMYINRDDPFAIQLHQFYDHVTPLLLEHPGQALGKPVLNIFLNSRDPQRFKQVYQLLREVFEPGLQVVKAGDMLIDVLSPGVSKGTGLQELADSLGIPARDIIAIGDNHNDIEMLKMAGIGVAMGTADDVVRAAANMETLSCDEDGVAVVLEQLLDI